MKIEKADILGTKISVFDRDETCDFLAEEAIRSKKSGKLEYVCVSNVHTVTEAYLNPDFLTVNNGALLATADGVPLLWASKILDGSKIHGRASGPDILHEFVMNPKYAHLKHYFYGSSREVINELRKNLLKMNPLFKIAGEMSPPIRKTVSIEEPLSSEEKSELQMIADSGADLIWVGLGAPKQEIFMYRASKSNSSGGIMLGVGAAFDFLSGNKKRAPFWMQKLGLEWFHRLLSEPRRLAGRYLKTNPYFVAAVLRQKFLS